jgi:hypothetical protein
VNADEIANLYTQVNGAPPYVRVVLSEIVATGTVHKVYRDELNGKEYVFEGDNLDDAGPRRDATWTLVETLLRTTPQKLCANCFPPHA